MTLAADREHVRGVRLDRDQGRWVDDLPVQLHGALAHQADVDTLIQRAAPQWPLAQMAKVDVNILRLAVYELAHGHVPAKVVINEAVELANEYAPEHLGLSVREPWRWVEKVRNAGGVFMGEHSFEVLGDYLAGPSHVMPTGGSARFASPLNVWDFVKIVSLVALDEGTAQAIGPSAATIADAEGLDAHGNAALLRVRGAP